MAAVRTDSFGARTPLPGAPPDNDYFALDAARPIPGAAVDRLPVSLKVLLENLLRHENGTVVTRDDIEALARWPATRHSEREVAFHPARVLMPDSSGAPLIADLSAMRDAMLRLGGDPAQINPVIPVDLVLDHSVTTRFAGTPTSFRANIAHEFAQNRERYVFLRWAQKAYRNLRIVPPGTGILHQVNLEFLAQPVQRRASGNRTVCFPDTLVGMDSHTPMINALAVFGWGVGGIEAASAMLGEPISMLIPDVVGCRLNGRLREGVTSTDLVLTATQALRAKGVVGKIVEFYGPGLAHLSLPDRATLANMSPEYGATMGFFPIDAETIRYLSETGRDPEQVALTERYAKRQGLWANGSDLAFSDTLEIDLDAVETSLAGPRRPQDRRALGDIPASFARDFRDEMDGAPRAGEGRTHGDVVIAAITSCTNTSNPSVMMRAGLLARNAVAKGLRSQPWVKASLSPGSRVVTDYLTAAGLQDDLDRLGFNLAGYGCMTCAGGSGPLLPGVGEEVVAGKVVAASVLSGNRNFEGRIHPLVRANYLAAPPLVVAYALAGSVRTDLRSEPLATTPAGERVFLADIWPSDVDVREALDRFLSPALYRDRYADVFEGGPEWQALAADDRPTFAWDAASTYLLQPPFLDAAGEPPHIEDIRGARALAVLGDSVTTDHISPAGHITEGSLSGRYLIATGVAPADFNSFVARRGNHEVMVRGTFANVRLRNEMAPGREGGFTRHIPSGEMLDIYDAAERYRREGVPVVVIAGAEYGTGSSRDWAAKGAALLGVRAVIAESFERIHRSNLIGMGVLPLEFTPGATRKTLALDGSERFEILGLDAGNQPRTTLRLRIAREDGTVSEVPVLSRIDTQPEAEWYRSGGVLPYVLGKLLALGTAG